MTRRSLLILLAAGGAIATGAVFGFLGGTAEILGKTRRAPSDLVARLRRRTRPLDPASLSIDHDLAG